MKRVVLLAVLALAAAVPAGAKDVDSIVVVGADGRARTIAAERAVVAVLFYHPASVYNVRPHAARPRGGYVRIYPVGIGGIPVEPGRFYPAAGALCFDWNQALPPRRCGRLGTPTRLLAASRRVRLFRGPPTVLASLDPGGTVNLFAALELAFDRYRESRASARPARCIPFVADWYGPRAAVRPTHLCVSQRGVYARGRLYTSAPATWRLASGHMP